MPLSYGFRGGNEFWFATHNQPFHIPTRRRTRVRIITRIYYAANKIDPGRPLRRRRPASG